MTRVITKKDVKEHEKSRIRKDETRISYRETMIKGKLCELKYLSSKRKKNQKRFSK
jgi:hypothetical protein